MRSYALGEFGGWEGFGGGWHASDANNFRTRLDDVERVMIV